MSDAGSYVEKIKEAPSSGRRNRWDQSANERKKSSEGESSFQSFNVTQASDASTHRSHGGHRERRRFTESDPSPVEGKTDKDEGDSLDSWRDEALEEHFRQYQEQKAESRDSESQKRHHSAAFSHISDLGPVDEEPQPKKMGFSMTMSRSQPATVSMNMLPKGTGFSMPQSKLQPISNPLLSQSKKSVAPIKMSLGVQKPKAAPVIKKPTSVANVFNEEDDSDEEEMPPEAKMRMRNLGRETPTAAGPNSFGKGQLGFCDRHKIIQRELQKKMDEIGAHN